jgi:hypothetical protein
VGEVDLEKGAWEIVWLELIGVIYIKEVVLN